MWLFQLGVFSLGLFQDGDVGVGVFPECDEVLVGGQAFAVSSAMRKHRLYSGRPMRRSRSWKRGSERKGS
jgi:hypothetical protein